MEQLLQFFILLPLLGLFVVLLLPHKNERAISGVVLATVCAHLLGMAVFIVNWLLNQCPTLDIKHFTIYDQGDIAIFIDFFFDKTTAVFGIVGSTIAVIVAFFSKTYMHREAGYKRYFIALLFFFSGYNIVVFAGNFETLFAGWELVGITSFLLIAFYRDRYLPVRNAMKVVTIYRLGDVALILAMWMSHHLWHENITFLQLNDATAVLDHLTEHQWFGVFIAGMVVLAAAAKSAQLPFSSWLPRAMEGPTTSSAIFYGSLSVHLGVFLLLRTYPYWESIGFIKALICFIGLFTCVVATLIAHVQPTVKTQIAYASIAQLGLMFIEVALGWHWLALVHFAGNAFLRTYQLLVSPSVLSYRIHNMLFSFQPGPTSAQGSFLAKLKNTMYMLSVKEWNLDFMLNHFLWRPFKWLGSHFAFLNKPMTVALLTVFFLFGLFGFYFQESVPPGLYDAMPYFFSALSLALILKAFATKGDALRAWGLIVLSQLFIAVSIALFNDNFGHNHILTYLSGSAASAAVGYVCLRKIRAIDNDIFLDRFHGYSYEQPLVAGVFLLACLGLIGLPFTPTFIGIDLLFNHMHKREVEMVVVTTLSFLFVEIAILRIYARVFLGQHKKPFHPIAFKSS